MLEDQTKARRALWTAMAWRFAESLLLLLAGALIALRIRGDSVWVGLGAPACLIFWVVLLRLEPFSLLVRQSKDGGWEIHQ